MLECWLILLDLTQVTTAAVSSGAKPCPASLDSVAKPRPAAVGSMARPHLAAMTLSRNQHLSALLPILRLLNSSLFYLKIFSEVLNSGFLTSKAHLLSHHEKPHIKKKTKKLYLLTSPKMPAMYGRDPRDTNFNKI